MRKTQVALAALALVASTAALAEGVKIYGALDAGLARSTGETMKFQSSGGFIAGNNWGMTGSEDLGGGMKAGFTLQQGIDLNGNSDNGGNGTLFNQLGFVSIGSENSGTIRLGQQLSPFIAGLAGNMAGNGHFFVNRLIMAHPGTFHGAGGPTLDTCATVDGNTGVATARNTACGAGIQQGGFFQENAVTYTSPSINGWTGTVMKTMKQGSGNTSAALATLGAQNVALNGDSYTAANVAGTIGDVSVNLVYQSRSDTYTSTGLGLTLPVDRFKLMATYMDVKSKAAGIAANALNQGSDGDGRVTSYSFGVTYDISDATTIAAQIASNNASNLANTISNQTLTGLHLKHTLSKQTFVYAMYLEGTNGAQSDYSNRGTGSGLALTDRRTYGFGVGHSF